MQGEWGGEDQMREWDVDQGTGGMLGKAVVDIGSNCITNVLCRLVLLNLYPPKYHYSCSMEVPL